LKNFRNSRGGRRRKDWQCDAANWGRVGLIANVAVVNVAVLNLVSINPVAVIPGAPLPGAVIVDELDINVDILGGFAGGIVNGYAGLWVSKWDLAPAGFIYRDPSDITGTEPRRDDWIFDRIWKRSLSTVAVGAQTVPFYMSLMALRQKCNIRIGMGEGLFLFIGNSLNSTDSLQYAANARVRFSNEL